jgi:hypothetical protein
MIEYFIPFVVGLLWGTTNYLIEKYYNGNEVSKDASFIEKVIFYIKNNKLAILFYLLNQLGSILFYLSLGKISKPL